MHVFFKSFTCRRGAIMQAENFLYYSQITTDGKIDIDEVTWFMGKYLPDRLQDFIADALTNCLEYAGDN